MKKLTNLFCLLIFIPIFGQTFTLQELETYSKYDFETFSNKVMVKGYEFNNTEDNSILFRYTASNVNNYYLMSYTETSVVYSTTYKSSYTNLVNSMKKKGYKYIESTNEGKNRVCSRYYYNNIIIGTCLGSLDKDYYTIPYFEVHIFPINIEEEEEEEE